MKRAKELIHKMLVFLFSALIQIKNSLDRKTLKVGFLTEEFFDVKLRGFGGYGMLVKYITEYFNNKADSKLKASVLLAVPISERGVQLENYHSAPVLLLPKNRKNYILNYIRYTKLFLELGINLFISVEYFTTYEYQLLLYPWIPWVLWFQDPRSKKEWEKIATVDLELKTLGNKRFSDILRECDDRRLSFKKVIKESNKLGRRVLFATQARFLVNRVRDLYEDETLTGEFLPNPLLLPQLKESNFFGRPSFLLLGRLDPIKRPWVFFELAKKFKDMDFYVAGATHFPELMDSIISRYRDIPNLKFFGRVVGKQKEDLLNRVWAIVNTSIHEALPVSFLESFAYGKPVISCQNPDLLTENYGIYTGEILGNGFDVGAIDRFAQAIEKFASPKIDRVQLGRAARAYVEKYHCFEYFDKQLHKILNSRGI
ncbi:MAG: glycosyltransferase family 4 protein [Candidatus Omnitrophica bacterium]|nr:glycosyltransferase family 4 protein [Candidatus Omnitrophota bacterium]